ncbi:5-formyltetrahydrofolate cyclo-ligase (plasmid) [Halalkaliarchaeum sp. AArc-CO]|uniref:5-formyltetrahydrofolate cyclo-ligase n=1 Tax=Halalkaliarchaeum sp. AArc-CO TaxID=2866381 RepID=UPI00217F20E3|nr:5-formyltetrahydrofolate cyclo-ligase [Halalkaliarchaeum sp. AArc-CO]UWG49313.1 5-formyltetrahydrofolate cyclo-ligase [Halalkaliarchaeum sp. AArc-CO]
MKDDSKRSHREQFREQVWEQLREVAYPDSRFAWDFGEFIADYEGSERGTEHLRTLATDLGVESWFVTPDNNLDSLRESLVRDDIPFIMPSYGILRGFLELQPDEVPDGDENFAGTLDGVNRFGREISLSELEEAYDQFDILVTGTSFVTEDGLRMGKGHGFFDLEWGMLREIGLVDENTTVVAAAHEVQVIDADEVDRDELLAEHDTIVDYIVSPSGIHEVEETPPKPKGIYWDLIDDSDIEKIPPLKELYNRR